MDPAISDIPEIFSPLYHILDRNRWSFIAGLKLLSLCPLFFTQWFRAWGICTVTNCNFLILTICFPWLRIAFIASQMIALSTPKSNFLSLSPIPILTCRQAINSSPSQDLQWRQPLKKWIVFLSYLRFTPP